jgi:uncharacterized damage-inducible protein DinB
LNWIHDFMSVKPMSFRQSSLFEPLPKFGERQFADIDSFTKARSKVDYLFLSLAEELSDDLLSTTIERTNRKGEKQRLVFWKALLHVFNHHTHHRGQISQILDQRGIENDYSVLINIQ